MGMVDNIADQLACYQLGNLLVGLRYGPVGAGWPMSSMWRDDLARGGDGLQLLAPD